MPLYIQHMPEALKRMRNASLGLMEAARVVVAKQILPYNYTNYQHHHHQHDKTKSQVASKRRNKTQTAHYFTRRSVSDRRRSAIMSCQVGGDATPAASPAVLLSPDNVRDLVDSVDAFLFDCDGVIWKGDQLIDGVPETLDMLRSKGKKLVFVTNNSRKSRRQYAKKFQSLGITVHEDEIFSSSFAAAMYLKVNHFPREKKVYVIGEEGILEELQLAGYTGLGGPEDGKKTVELKANQLFEHDKNVGAVVVGLDQYINYYKLQYGTLCIRENPGCLFVATNRDAVGHMTNLQEWPGAGCMVAAVCGTTHREPIVVGKPSTFMMQFLLEKFQISPSRMCMVGDRLDTDILFGKNAGCRTLLVLSGCTDQSALQANHVQPEYFTNRISDVYKYLTP